MPYTPDQKLKDRNSPWFPAVQITASTFASAWAKIFCFLFESGLRIETPKHQSGRSPLGWDGAVSVRILRPMDEPFLCTPGVMDLALDFESYRLEVICGIHDEWLGRGWDYTYHERIRKHKISPTGTIDQISVVLARIEEDFKTKGRVSGRDYFVSTFYPNDYNLEDRPCLQLIQWRLTEAAEQYYLHQFSVWRSRDFVKAWLENNFALRDLLRLMAKWLTERLGVPIEIGTIQEHNQSLHIYGAYDKSGEMAKIYSQVRGKPPTMPISTFMGDVEEYRRLIAGRLAAMRDPTKQHLGKKLPEKTIREILAQQGQNLDTYPYPSQWDE